MNKQTCKLEFFSPLFNTTLRIVVKANSIGSTWNVSRSAKKSEGWVEVEHQMGFCSYEEATYRAVSMMNNFAY